MVDRRRQEEERDGFLGHLMLSQAAAKAWLNIYSSVRGRTKRELLRRRAVSVTREYSSLSYELGPFRLSLAWARSECIRGAAKGWKPHCGTANKKRRAKKFAPRSVALVMCSASVPPGVCVLYGTR